MKKSVAAFIGMAVLAAVVGLTACGQGQSLPEPAVALPVKLAAFNHVKYDYDMDLGDYLYKFDLTQAQQTEFIRLLQADQWIDRGELPGRCYTTIIDADDGQGWHLVVGYWDEAYTVIGLFDDALTQKIFYFAPFEVQEDAEKFRNTLKK